MHRNYALKLLEQYLPSKEEETAKARIIAFIQDNENCFERSLSSGHVTASAWLLSKDLNKALLTHHTKLNNWFQLGGHCDGNADILAVAIKEAQEESGILGIVPVMNSIFDVDIHSIPANQKEAAHYHYDIRFLLKVESNEQVKSNLESKELRWVSKDIFALPTRERSILRMFEKWSQYYLVTVR
jgi:8-oxo-dGTP pyrophosphatase MutT (NUDIX family)